MGDMYVRGMSLQSRPRKERYFQLVGGLALGLIGWVVAEFLVQAVWPTFLGLFVGSVLGAWLGHVVERRSSTDETPGGR